MSSLSPSPADSEIPPPSDDTLRLMRRLLRSAVLHYQLTLAFAREVERAFPDAYRMPWDEGKAMEHKRKLAEAELHWPEGNRGAWLRLSYEADSNFYAAEMELATRIVNLYNWLAPEGKRSQPVTPDREWPERAVTTEGLTYMVIYDPALYQEGDVIISVSPIERTIVLDD